MIIDCFILNTYEHCQTVSVNSACDIFLVLKAFCYISSMPARTNYLIYSLIIFLFSCTILSDIVWFLLSECCVLTSFYQKLQTLSFYLRNLLYIIFVLTEIAKLVTFYPFFFLRILLYIIKEVISIMETTSHHLPFAKRVIK